MDACEYIDHCELFNNYSEEFSDFRELVMKRYCFGNKAKCARRRVYKSVGSPCVSQDLLPSQNEKAKNVMLDCTMKKKKQREILKAV